VSKSVHGEFLSAQLYIGFDAADLSSTAEWRSGSAPGS
jgi:hypothetical protein